MDGAVRGRRLRLSLLLLAGPAAFLAAFYALPLLRTLAAADLDAWAWVAGPYVQARLRVALLQAVLSVALTLALALPLAWLHHRYRIPWGRAHLALHAAPFVMPVFVIVYGLQLTLGPTLAPLAAVVVAHAYYNYGFAARLLHAALDRRPRRLEEAAQALGATPRGAFLRVSLPLLLPSIVAVALLVFAFTFASFGTVLFLGAGKVSTLETLLYANMGGAFPRLDRAAALGALQLAINLTLLLAYVALLRRDRGLERDARPGRDRPRAWHVALAWGALAAALVPALAVLVGGFQVGGRWSLEAWRALMDPAHPAHLAGFDLGRALGLSLGYAAASLLLALSLTVLLAYGARRLGGRTRGLAEALAALPLATSSLLLGLGYVLAFGAGALLDLRGSALVIVLAHTLVAFPFTARVILPAFALHDRRLDEAAALAGAGPLAVARRVTLPLLAGPLAAAAGLAAAMSLGDFGASLLLMRTDNMGLTVWIARHDAPFDPLLQAQAIALAGLLAVLVALAYLGIERLRPEEVRA